MKIRKYLINKKSGALLLALSMCFSFAACHKDSEKPETEPDVVTHENRADYNFSEKAGEYLDIIGTKFTNRNLSAEGDTAEPENKHEEVKNWIVSELKKAGYADESISVDEFKCSNAAKGNKAANIVVTIQGRDKSKQVIVGTHYDGDGVGDNGSGVALLLANACGLVKKDPQYTIKMIFFDGEEDGMLGSTSYVENMTNEEKKATLYMINMDSLGFGDYCNIYGGVPGKEGLAAKAEKTEAYDFAMKKAQSLGFKTYGTEELDGYFAKNKKGPEIESDAVYTNPWTNENQSPKNFFYPSPSTGDWGDHVPFKDSDIKYVYFEATNWYAEGDGGEGAYTGYFDTDRTDIGNKGMFMNTKYDTLDNLNKYFPGRVKQHFDIYSPLLSGLLLDAGGIAGVK